MRIRPFVFLLFALSAIILSSCTPNSVRKRNFDFAAVVAEIDTMTAEVLPQDSSDLESALYIQVDVLVDGARIACGKHAFQDADSLLRLALTQLQTGNETYSIEEEQEFILRQEAIASVYTDLFPPDYIDKLPENIASFIFQRQLTLSLDSLQMSPEDSARLASLNCRQGIPYNVPLAWNERVQKALLVIMKRRPESLKHWLSRANYYLPVMRRLFADSSLPTDLAYLPLIESGFNPMAYSWAHASGIWQFISSTGYRYGLRENYWYDERRDPIKSTKAAISYLKKLYGDFGDWHLALAAYNCGENGLARAIEKAQTSDYWQLKLPSETMNYVPKYLAALMVAKNPACFGFAVPPPADTFDLDTVHVSECLDLKKIAAGLGMAFTELKEINPHISRWCTPPDASNVTLYLPKGKAADYGAYYATLTEKDKVKWRLHRIRRGDNLLAIARRYGIPLAVLKDVNNLKSTRLVAGNYLYIPVPATQNTPDTGDAHTSEGDAAVIADGPAGTTNPNQHRLGNKTTYRVRPGETLWELSARFGVSVKNICEWNSIRHPGMVQAGEVLTIYGNGGNSGQTADAGSRPQVYTVKSGDNLYSISRQLGMSVQELAAMNNRRPDDFLIYPGQKLRYGSNAAGCGGTNSRPGNSTCDYVSHVVSKGDNLYSISKRYSVGLDKLYKANKLNEKSILSIGDTVLVPVCGNNRPKSKDARILYHTVRKGDNLWRIAQAYSVPINRLCAANGITSDTVLMPGDSLRIILAAKGM